jgi:hypothetical protein
MIEMLHEYRTDEGVKVLEDCARARKQARRHCQWHGAPAHAEQARLDCEVCSATVEPLPRPEPPDMGTLVTSSPSSKRGASRDLSPCGSEEPFTRRLSPSPASV